MNEVALTGRSLTSMTSELELSLWDLPRHIGSVRSHDMTWEVPDDLGTSSMHVEPGTSLPFSATLTSIEDGVLVQLRCNVTLLGECVRCLDPVYVEHDIDTAEVFFEPEALRRMDAESDEPVSPEHYQISSRDTIDLETLLRDTIVTRVDALPLCSPDCAGLCQECGEKWADLPQDHAHEVIDPRLAGLAALLPKDFVISTEGEEE